ncbi:MAG: hypothetical protein JWO49_1157 [Arthrobacter sp.]|nr:hypothetical protein [Arthrobacter sp.]
MPGKYELFKDRSGEFRFRLKAGNGEVIAASQGYKTRAAALRGIASVMKNADSVVVDLTKEPGNPGGRSSGASSRLPLS